MSTEHVGKRMAKCLTLNDTIITSTTTTTPASTSTTDNQATLPQKQQHETTTTVTQNYCCNNDKTSGDSPNTSRHFVVMRKLKNTTTNSGNGGSNNGPQTLHQNSTAIDMANSSISNQSFTNDSGNPTSPSSLSSNSPTSPPGGGDPVSAELRQLKRDCDPQFSRFADYFVICGLDLDTGLEPDRFAGKFRKGYLFITINRHV